jgi:hypothetical protein
MKKLLLLILFAFAGQLIGQNYFNNRIDINHSHENLSTNILKCTAGYLVFGTSSDTSNYYSKFSAAQINSAGTVLLKKEITNPTYVPYLEGSTSAVLSGINNYLCATTKYEASTTQYSLLLYKLDNNLDTIFVKQYAYLSKSIIPTASLICATNTDQKGIFVFGIEYFSTSSTPLQPFVIKIDSLGNALWKKNYYTLALSSVNFISPTTKGGVIIGYNTNAYASGPPPNPPPDSVIMCLDSSGSQLWMLHKVSLKMIQTKNKGYLSLSTKYSTGYFQHPKITKLDSMRNVTWHKEFILPYDAAFTNFVELPDSSYVLSGYRTNPVSTLTEGIIAKVGKNGDSLWVETIKYNSTLNCQFTDIYQDALGGFVLSGNVDTTQSNTTKSDFWIIGTDSNGCYTGCAGMSLLEKTKSGYNQITIYPNPTSGAFTIKSNTTDKLTVNLYDVNGRHVFSKTIVGSTDIDATNLDNGVYSLTIKSSTGITNKKLIISR